MTASGHGDRFDTGRGGGGGWGGVWGWGGGGAADYPTTTATRASIPASLACPS